MIAATPLLRTSHASPTAVTDWARINRIELVFAALTTAVYSCGVIRLLFDNQSGAIAPLYREIWLVLYALTLLLLARHASETKNALLRSPELVFLTLLPMVSLVWSTSPEYTLTRAIPLFGTSLFGLYLAIRFTPQQLLQLLAFAAFLVAVLSFLLIFGVPSIGISTHPAWPNAWEGAFMHKNGLGAGAALGSALSILLLLGEESRRRVWVLVALMLNLILLAASQSVTSQLSLLVMVSIVFGVRVVTGRAATIAVPILISLLPLTLAAVYSLDAGSIEEMLKHIGKEGTLSGRIPLWTSVWTFIEERFWLGYGYEAFWVQGHLKADIIEALLRWRPAYSHNGILELFLALGFVGVLVFLIVMSVFFWRLLCQLPKAPLDTLNSLALLWTSAFVVRNVSEAAILSRDDIIWCMFIALYLMLARRAGT